MGVGGLLAVLFLGSSSSSSGKDKKKTTATATATATTKVEELTWVGETKEAAPAPATEAEGDNVESAKKWIGKWKDKKSAADPAGTVKVVNETAVASEPEPASTSDNVEEAKGWIGRWKARRAAKKEAAKAAAKDDEPENVKEAKAWIQNWRNKQ